MESKKKKLLNTRKSPSKSIADSEIISRIINTFVVPVLVVAYVTYLIQLTEISLLHYFLAPVIFIFTILIIANQKWLDKQYVKLILEREDIITGAVFDYIKITVEYLDSEGKQASIRRHDFISNFIWKENELHPVELRTDGEIVQSGISTIHSYWKLETPQFIKFFLDGNQRKNNNERHVHYSCLLKNGFIQGTEYWVISGINYSKYYRLEIIIPDRTVQRKNVKMSWRPKEAEGKRVGNTEVLKRENPNKWTEVAEARILITQACNRTIIYTYVPGLLPTEEFKLEWTLDPK
jgi:hypothetical protein